MAYKTITEPHSTQKRHRRFKRLLGAMEDTVTGHRVYVVEYDMEPDNPLLGITEYTTDIFLETFSDIDHGDELLWDPETFPHQEPTAKHLEKALQDAKSAIEDDYGDDPPPWEWTGEENPARASNPAPAVTANKLVSALKF